MNTDVEQAFRYGKVHQVGLVVEDMKYAVERCSSLLGIRRWYRAVNKTAGEVVVRGKPVKCRLDFVLGFCGKTQVELIASSGDGNIYTEFLESHGPGLHHVCFFVTDLQRKMEAYANAGLSPIQTGRVESKGGTITRYAYFDPGPAGGLIIELSESRLAGKIPVRMSPFMMKIGRLTGDLEPVTVDKKL